MFEKFSSNLVSLKRCKINDNHKEKLRMKIKKFATRICQNRILASASLFDMFTQSVKFYTFHFTY